MTIAALITEGIGPGGSVLYALTGGLDIGATPPAPPLVYSGYPVRNYVLKSTGIERRLASNPYRERVLKGPPLPARRLQN